MPFALLAAGLDYKAGSGNDTKWLFICASNSDCPSGYSCMGGKGMKSPGGICAKIKWCASGLVDTAHLPVSVCPWASAAPASGRLFKVQ